MPMRSLVIALVVSATIACGGTDNPFTPPTNPPDGSGTVSGTLVSYGDRYAPVGASVVIGQTIATTDAQGKFSLPNLPGSGAGIITANAPGYVFRGFGVSLSQVPPNLTIDILRDTPPFSLQFYRFWARNGYESPELQATKPWTRSPSFYVRMIVVARPRPRASIRRWSIGFATCSRSRCPSCLAGASASRRSRPATPNGRRRRAGSISRSIRSSAARSARPLSEATPARCRSATEWSRTPTTNPTNCMTPEVSIADHEITHTMGFWHTPDIFGDTFSGPGCPGAPRPEYIRYHSAVMYSRPVGNRDPDVDPVPATGVQAPGAAAAIGLWWSASEQSDKTPGFAHGAHGEPAERPRRTARAWPPGGLTARHDAGFLQQSARHRLFVLSVLLLRGPRVSPR